MKVLYVEDNESLATLVCSLLRGHGFEVEHFALGEPALARFREDTQSWDAAMIDLELPDIPGEKLLPELTALRPSFPIVVYSGVRQVGERIELYASGASALVAKPCGAQDLLDVLRGLIEIPPTPIK